MRHSIAISLLVPLAACATIMHGTKQDVGFSSTPTSARVIVDSQPVGQTPTIAHLARKQNHIVRMELDGYQPFETTLTRKTSGWTWGNIVFGGIIGVAVDASNGAMYQLTPEQVSAQMVTATQAGDQKPPQEQALNRRGDAIYVAVVLRPDPAWKRIGTLERTR